MTEGLSQTKSELRIRHRELTRQLTQAQRSDESKIVFQQLLDDPAWRAAKRILLYSPLADEPNLVPYLSPANQPEKEFYLPRFRPVSSDYCAARFAEHWEDLVPATFGIREPSAKAPDLALNQLDFIVVPGLAFDCQGHRLGRGKGFYDLLLAQTPGLKCGVGFDHQLVMRVPVEAHDIRLNLLITPAKRVEFT